MRDICEAGDTVLASLGAEFLTKKSLRAACQPASIAACRQVAAIGVSSIHPVAAPLVEPSNKLTDFGHVARADN